VKNNTLRRTAIASALAVSTATLSLLPALSASAVVGGPKTPGMLKVERTGATLTDLAIAWKGVAGVDHYTVTVFNGTKDLSQVVDANTTRLVVPAPGECTRWQVRVSAVDADGNSAATNPFRVAPLAPGGVSGMDVDRSLDGTNGVVFWNAPRNPGAGTPAYQVQLKELASGRVVDTVRTNGTRVAFDGLEPKRAYAAKVTASNDFGSCVTSTSLLRNEKPAEPTGVSVTRESSASSIALLTWTPPKWRGYGAVDAYEIVYRAVGDKTSTVAKVPADQTSAKLELDPKRSWTFQVRAVGTERGSWSKVATLMKDLPAGTAELDPAVSIAENNGTVTVDFSGPVGSSSTYPTMVLSIKPTVATKGFSDSHTVSNRAGQAEFTQVPCGVYTVTVTGTNGDKSSKEFGRQVINRCDTGAIPAADWKLVFGKADIKGTVVDMKYGNESRVMSTTKRDSKDAVFTTEATLRSGYGYGIWTRASLKNGASVSGYSFQYDPGYANVSNFGKALLLRVWDNGRECGTPVAKVKWPAGLDVNAKHKVVVVNKGDSLYASIDGIKMFDVPSLKDAMKTSGCSANFAEPNGTEVGFRSWNATSSVVFENTTLS
jgi:hypothetical protein